MTKTQSLVRQYCNLPWHTQIAIEAKFGLLQPDEHLIATHERLKLIFQRVKDRNLIDDFFNEVEIKTQEHITKTTHP